MGQRPAHGSADLPYLAVIEILKTFLCLSLTVGIPCWLDSGLTSSGRLMFHS